jgi:hypothetical protein
MIPDLEVFFEGLVIGRVSSPTLDNFNFYGRWSPAPGPALTRFLALVENDGEASVVLGRGDPPLTGIVESVPNRELDVRVNLPK